MQQVGKKFTDPDKFGGDYFVGDTYTIAPRTINAANTTVSDGTIADITYKLSDNKPPSMLVDTATGVISGVFDEAALYTFQLIAIDQAGEVAVMEEHKIVARKKAVGTKFVLATLGKGVRTEEGEQFIEYNADATYFVGESYRIAPLAIDAQGTTVSEGTSADIRYTLDPDAPGSFFVSVST
jgi:hypothetical protein